MTMDAGTDNVQDAAVADLSGRRSGLAPLIARGAGLLLLWALVYGRLESASVWLTYGLLRLPRERHLSAAVQFFLYEVPKVLMLLVLVVFAVGVIRSYFTPERTRRILTGRRESAGNVLAALLGVVTPFCSCSRASSRSCRRCWRRAPRWVRYWRS